MVRVLLDGAVVAANYDVSGQVQGVEVSRSGLPSATGRTRPVSIPSKGRFSRCCCRNTSRRGTLSIIDPCCSDRDALRDLVPRHGEERHYDCEACASAGRTLAEAATRNAAVAASRR